MQPLVSVIIPTYNSVQYIKDALESVFNQTYKNIEVIVVDDGSTDNTKEALKPYLDRMQYIYKENGGPASARNLGIKNARGEYIAFLDADDVWLLQKLEKQIDLFIRDESIGLVHTRFIGFKNSINELLTDNSKNDDGGLSGHIFSKLFWENFIANSSVFIKKECFEKVNLFDENKDFISVEDYDMWLRISKEYKVGFINQTLGGYRIHNKGISKQINRYYLNEKTVIEKMIKSYPEIEQLTGIRIRDRFAKLYNDYGLALLEEEKLPEARENFLTSLRYNHLNLKRLGNYMKSLLPAKLFKTFRYIKKKLLCP